MPSSAWTGWLYFESPVEVEAAKSVPCRRLMLRAVQLSSEVYSSCGGEGFWCNVLYQLRPLNFQYPHRVKPLEILTSLDTPAWCRTGFLHKLQPRDNLDACTVNETDLLDLYKEECARLYLVCIVLAYWGLYKKIECARLYLVCIVHA